MIQLTNVVKLHGITRTLDGVTLALPRGQVTALIGPSGGGKSTLLRCINGLEEFQEGEISLDNQIKVMGGQPTPQKTLLQLRRKVGMVFQQFNLFPHMTALKNVMSGPLYALKKPYEEAERLAKTLLSRVGLADKAHLKPTQLSGGQQQRVAIARSLAVNPAAILFDEPTSALDPRMAAEVMRVIDDLADDEQFQAAMVIVTHDLVSIRKIADTVHVLERGRVTYSGSAAEAFGPNGPAAALE
jgi:ABC-type polar amino acid transport system ATPase subunit